jgi:hypothetical protein
VSGGIVVTLDLAHQLGVTHRAANHGGLRIAPPSPDHGAYAVGL